MQKMLEKHSLVLEWDPSKSSSVKGGITHFSPSEYLENIANIVYQYDIAINCIIQYFDALNLHQPKSYENLMKSISISTESNVFAEEFIAKSTFFYS